MIYYSRIEIENNARSIHEDIKNVEYIGYRLSKIIKESENNIHIDI